MKISMSFTPACSQLTFMKEDPQNTTASTHFLFIAKNLERMGDHATNIAETVHFQIKGTKMQDDRPKGEDASYIVTFQNELSYQQLVCHKHDDSKIRS